MPNRKTSPEENKIINTHLEGMLDELVSAGIKAEAVLAFIAFEGWDYHVATMLNVSVTVNVEQAMGGLIQYAHEALGEQISGAEHRAAEIPGRGRVEGVVMDRAVTESMGWRARLETIRKIPRAGDFTMTISTKMLDDVIAALDHLAQLETGIHECEDDGGCRATKFVKEEEKQRPLTN